MTIHTIMPLELVFDGMSAQPDCRPLVEIESGDMRLQIEPLYPGVGRIVRLVSCPLDHYLRQDLAPGSLFVYGKAADSDVRI